MTTRLKSIVLWRFRLGFSTAYNIVGLLFLILAFTLQSPIEINNALELIGELRLTKTAMWMLIVAGCLSLIVGFVTSAVCGLKSGFSRMILPVLYVIGLICIVIMQFVFGIYILNQRDKAREALFEGFSKLSAVDYQSTEDRDRLVLTALQLSLECCGFTRGCQDWDTATIALTDLGITNLIHIAPDCTCRAEGERKKEECSFYGNLNEPNTTCFDNTNGEKAVPLYSTTCYSRIANHVENRSAVFGSVLLVVAIMEFLGLISAFFVIRQVTWDYRTTGDQSIEEVEYGKVEHLAITTASEESVED